VRTDLRATPAAAPVLGRILAVLSARARLGVDRVGDVLLAGDTLCAAVCGLPEERLLVAADVHSGRLELEIGPYPAGRAAALVSRARLDGMTVLEALADDVAVAEGNGLETLRLTFTQPG
jgi:hypothetical protein